jgi:hypothetical protein
MLPGGATRVNPAGLVTGGPLEVAEDFQGTVKLFAVIT